jgi:hypothetical protein
LVIGSAGDTVGEHFAPGLSLEKILFDEASRLRREGESILKTVSRVQSI